MITKTIGTGGDYATIDAALTAYGYWEHNKISLDDDITFDLISSVTEPDTISWGGHTIKINGYTLLLTCSHNATEPNWLNWYTVTTPYYNGIQILGKQSQSTGIIAVSCIKVLYTYNGDSAGNCINILYANRFSVDRCILDCNNLARYGIMPQGTFAISRCKIWDAGQFGIYDYYGTSTIKNCTLYNATYHARGGTHNLYNVVSARNDERDCYEQEGSPTINYYNCAAKDSTITSTADYQEGCVEGIINADEFVSLDDTNAEFLFPKSGGNIATGGIDVGYSTDIVGSPIPGPDGLYSIGCHEFQGTSHEGDGESVIKNVIIMF